MNNAGRSPKEILEDMTAFALSSATLLAKARSLAVGEALSFVPSAVTDGSPVQQPLASSLASPFMIRRIAIDQAPPEYGISAEDMSGQFIFLVTPAAEPERHQLAVVERERE